MFRGAIFDLDGTLLNSMPVWNTLVSAYLRTIGETPRADVDAAVGSFSLQQTARYTNENWRDQLTKVMTRPLPMTRLATR